MLKSSLPLLAALRRKAFATAAAGAVAGLLVLAAPLLLAGSAQAAWSPSFLLGSGAADTVLPANLLPAPTATDTNSRLQIDTSPTPSPTPAPTKPPVVVHPPAPAAVPTTAVPTTKAAVPAPTRAPAPAAAPTAALPPPSTSAAGQPTTAATIPESPWPTFVNTETASAFEPAGAGGGTDAGSPGPSAGAQLSLAGSGGVGHGMVWGS
jgi:outer membrane biosynthesis protein TonB